MLLDGRGVHRFGDYFMICSGDTTKQIEAIRDDVGEALIYTGFKQNFILVKAQFTQLG